MPHSAPFHPALPLALAIDIGSSSVRAVIFDANGHQLRDTEHRERYKLEVTPDGGSMCDPLRIRRLTARCISKTCERAGAHLNHIAVVGVSSHWHSLMGLDSAGTPITPVYMWSDKRSSQDADALQTELILDATHARTGCRLHSSYWPAKLRWLERTRQEVTKRVNTWCSLVDWLMTPDGGSIQTSMSMASATGMLTTATQAWDQHLIEHLQIAPDSLPPVIRRQTPIMSHEVHSDFQVPGLTATWFPAIGDGAAANIGAGAIGSDRVALTIGTSGAIRLARPIDASAPLPPGLFRYLIDDSIEVVGGALSNGGNMVAWLANLTQSKDRAALMNSAERVSPDSHGLTILPFFAGERAPSWQDDLGGTITGMSLDTTNAHILRAMLEATAHRFSSVYADLRQLAAEDHAIIANGGALLQSPLWSQITADALGHPLVALQARAEASARGAAIAALHAAGHLDSLRIDAEYGRQYAPDSAVHEIYLRAQKRLNSLESALTLWEKTNR